MRGTSCSKKGMSEEALHQARSALESMEWQLPLVRRLAELQPTAAREAALAFLIYNRSQYERS